MWQSTAGFHCAYRLPNQYSTWLMYIYSNDIRTEPRHKILVFWVMYTRSRFTGLYYSDQDSKCGIDPVFLCKNCFFQANNYPNNEEVWLYSFLLWLWYLIKLLAEDPSTMGKIRILLTALRGVQLAALSHLLFRVTQWDCEINMYMAQEKPRYVFSCHR